MNISKFLSEKLSEVNGINPFSEEIYEESLYTQASDKDGEVLNEIFSILHHNLNELLQTMNQKSQTYGIFHYSASDSRFLLSCISVYKEMKKVLLNTPQDFYLDNTYDEAINFLFDYLKQSEGSGIPGSYQKVKIVEDKPIFHLKDKVIKSGNVVQNNQTTFDLKLIGNGSYGQALKFKDTFYGKNFVLKRAHKDLDDKEIERFKQEYEILKKLSSPYIIKVYKIEYEPLSYIMDYADTNLLKLISKNPELSNATRTNIVLQILSAFKYINSKGILHRDIAPTNVLLDKYENDVYIVKISDFGLSKNPDNHLTSLNSDIKGTFNDPNLRSKGYAEYSFENEIYALTYLVSYIMTGSKNVEKIYKKSKSIKDFTDGGMNANEDVRYKTIDELETSFKHTDWS